jgi:hypothetical protein
MEQRSEFTSALGRALDDTGSFNRDEWAGVLGVTVQRIDSWLASESFPEPHHLSMVELTLSRSVLQNVKPLEEFHEMARKSLQEVTPLRPTLNGWRTIGPATTVEDYLNLPASPLMGKKAP